MRPAQPDDQAPPILPNLYRLLASFPEGIGLGGVAIETPEQLNLLSFDFYPDPLALMRHDVHGSE